ncbi:MAG: cutinase family protein [Mycobacteriaceae bacterium]|nr:cutinase family protein [Mycobacteriaceae bacterium]
MARRRWGSRPGSARSRGPRRLVKLLGALAALGLAIVLLWYLLAGCFHPTKPRPPKPPPTSQPASCPDVLALAVPGTWESSSGDNPQHPAANPQSLMGFVTRPLQRQFPTSRVAVYTVPYVAQFSNPIALPPDGQASYNKSRSEGMQRASDELSRMNQECPLSTYVLMGFSQGAVIVGDIAAQIGAGAGPVSADQVLGVALLADGRRQAGQGVPVGIDPPGSGAEIALGGLKVPGITMTGPRDDGFGVINDKVRTICAPGDMICDSPQHALSLFNIPSSVGSLVAAAGNPIHAGYNGYVVGPGVTATQWTERWAAGLIAGAPHPPHS